MPNQKQETWIPSRLSGTEGPRFLGYTLDGTGYLGDRLIAKSQWGPGAMPLVLCQARVKNDARQKQQEIMEKIGDVETWRLLE